MEKKEKRFQIILAIAVVVLLYLFLEGFGITCPIKFLTGISCAGCGMSRAWIAVFHLDFARAFYFHPLFFNVIPVHTDLKSPSGQYPGTPHLCRHPP